MKKILTVLLFTGFLALSICAEDVYHTGYVCRDMCGDKRWEAEVEIGKKESDIYIMIERSEGRYFGFEGEVSWIEEMEFEMTEDAIRPIRTEKRVEDAEGNPLEIDSQKFNYEDNTVTCLREDLLEHTSVRKKFRFTKEVVNRLILGLYIRKFIESGEKRKEFQMVTSEPALYNIKIEEKAEETIEVNGRERTSYRMCLDPELGMLSFVKVFLPKAYVWHSAEPDHEWLRYEGPEDRVNSPKVVITTSK